MSEATHYVWWFPGCPLRIHLELNFVERLQRRLKDPLSIPDNGLLLGSALGNTITILEFVPFPRHGAWDPGKDLPALIKEQRSGLVVGYYRTDQEEFLRLNSADLELADTFFKESYQVFLLVQAGGPPPATAGFFFREEGRMQGDVSFLEFPVDARLLRAAGTPAEDQPHAAITQSHSSPTVPLVTGASSVAVPRFNSTPSVSEAAHGGGRKRTWHISWAAFAIGFVALIVAVGIRLLPQIQIQVKTPAEVSARPSSLGLQVEMSNGAIRLTWDRTSDLVTNAASGMLVIKDGDSRREMQLGPDEVRAAGILYSPANDRVQFQLTVFGQKTATELVMALLSSPPPAHPGSALPAARAPEAGPLLPVAPAPNVAPRQPQPLKPFVAVNSIKKDDSPPRIAEPPSLVPQPVSAPASVPALLSQVTPPALDPASGDAPSTATPNAQAVYRPPVAIRSVPPQVPPQLRWFQAGPKILTIDISIDAEGKVVAVTPINSKAVPQPLISAAVDAARQWRFQPALRNGKPIASVMTLRFDFNLRP